MNNRLSTNGGPDANAAAPSKTLASWLTTIALVWLLVPSLTAHFQSIATQPENIAKATQHWQLGIGSASWLSIHRQGIGPMAQGRRGVDWEPAQFELHPRWMAVAPLSLVLLASLLVTPAWAGRLDPALNSLKRITHGLGQSVSMALAVGLIAVIVFTLALPGAHETILERADAEQLKERLSTQLGDRQPRYRLRLDRHADGRTDLVISRYIWNHFHPDPFGPLIQMTELQHGDLTRFRFPFNPAALALSVGAMLIAFGLSLQRQRRDNTADGAMSAQ